MKYRAIAIAAAALLASHAHALTPTQVADSSTIKVYASGASAIRNIVGGMFFANCASNIDVYFSQAGAGTSFTNDSANGDSHRVYTCTMKSGNALESDLRGIGLDGRNVAFYKRDAGGSGYGVFPLALNQNAASLAINATSCATVSGATPAATTPNWLCKASETVAVPDLGFSDVEPAFFKGINVPTGQGFPTNGLSASQLTTLKIVPTFQTVMAVAVSAPLYSALQTAQGTTGTPSIPRTVLGSILRGELADPQNGSGWQALNIDGATQQVNVCRRTAGSGTQAAANLTFSGFPCSNAVINAPAGNGASDDGQGTPYANNLTPASWTDGNLFVYEGSSSGNVASCLGAAADNGGYAVGHLSRDTGEGVIGSATTNKWKFAALDGIVPHRDNLKTGTYDYAVESTAQYRTSVTTTALSGVGDAKVKAKFIEGFAKAVGRPVNMNNLSNSAKAGLAALPSAGIYGGAGADGTFVSRVTKNGNNCAPFSVIQ